ncbi:putative membrane protein [Novosphingobium kunmingense]|uniref:Putative membrane protein n=1 Tax=Novosphingobium kunmingense TaxID=1211806 RepID=A0A2N0HK10_9SPHN|nr:DUF1345 domain-containing protein [Novosphingobium kunmingense]PKB19277.1 putative membrane protein [Novosphingobium kunmingense]
MSARGKVSKTANTAAPTIGNRLAPPRFLVFLALAPALYLTLQATGWASDWRDALAVAFDGAALVFLGSLWPVLRDAEPDSIRRHAADNDANRPLVLLITALVTLAVMAAITGELKAAKGGDLLAMAKLVGTLALIWAFANLVYAVHYAHVFYSRDAASGGDVGGLDFPGSKAPGYWDFAYFAMTLGMTFQTSDVTVTSSRLRRVVLFHTVVAFVFNIGVIAFTINALGGGSS